MDPTRSSHKRSSRRDTPSRRATPLSSEEQSRPSRASTSHTSHHSLPSIRHLHPYLPPSGMSQHIPGASESSNFNYPPPQSTYSVASGSNVHLGQHESPAVNMSNQTQESQRPSGPDSDQDGDDQHGPPKKKRRRQALSCTGQCHRWMFSNRSDFEAHVPVIDPFSAQYF